MQGLIILALLTVFAALWLKRILDKNLGLAEYERVGRECAALSAENQRLKEANRRLTEKLEGIIALYDITKQICRTLDADKVFVYFKEELNKYVQISDCRLIWGEGDLSEYKYYAAFPLKIQDRKIGYLVADLVREEDREKFYILCQQFLLGLKRAVLYRQVQESAITDLLTNTFNRRYYMERFGEEMERSRKFDYAFSCLMIDIDHFKDYNDRYGHIVGDAILRELSRQIQAKIRQIDLMGRYGGEEFSIILSETDKQAAQLVAERIRQAVEENRLKIYDEELKITVSIGISSFPRDAKTSTALIDKADAALYRAKQGGRNKVCLY